MGQGAGESLRLVFITSQLILKKYRHMKNNKPSLRRTKDEGGISGEDQSGPAGNNAPHGRSGHADPAMTPGISQAAKQARKEDQEAGDDETDGVGGDADEQEALLEQQRKRKQASTERD